MIPDWLSCPGGSLNPWIPRILPNGHFDMPRELSFQLDIFHGAHQGLTLPFPDSRYPGWISIARGYMALFPGPGTPRIGYRRAPRACAVFGPRCLSLDATGFLLSLCVLSFSWFALGKEWHGVGVGCWLHLCIRATAFVLCFVSHGDGSIPIPSSSTR